MYIIIDGRFSAVLLPMNPKVSLVTYVYVLDHFMCLSLRTDAQL